MLYVLSLRRRRGLLCSAGEIRPCPQPISAAAAPADEIPRCQVTRCAVSAQGGLGPRVRVCRIYGHALLLPGTDSDVSTEQHYVLLVLRLLLLSTCQ